jgi:hypothetical protein
MGDDSEGQEQQSGAGVHLPLHAAPAATTKFQLSPNPLQSLPRKF